MIFLVAFPILLALGWVFFNIQGPAKQQLDNFGTSSGGEGGSYDDFRDFFSAPVKQGPWTRQTPMAERAGKQGSN